jgi:hypothetical protein
VSSVNLRASDPELQATRLRGWHLAQLSTLGLLAFLIVLTLAGAFQRKTIRAQESVKPASAPVNVHFSDIRKQAGITFLQDSTQTAEKYYLETMGTGAA